jgi:pyridoxamine 5'-phosphate oxidase
MDTNLDYQLILSKFSEWFDQANKDQRITEPSAMSLATIGQDNQPSNRMVLLKKFDQNGFCFFTNLNSRKANEIKQNCKVSLCFYWGVLGKQIRIEGDATLVSNYEADQYFSSRPRQSKIGAWASIQSSEIKEWVDFENRIKEIEERFKDQEIPRPEFWSGFCVNPRQIEFWHEGEFRIHYREQYNKHDNKWTKKILYP